MKLNELNAGDIFKFSKNGERFAIEGLDSNKYKTCNKKVFKCLSFNLGIVAIELYQVGNKWHEKNDLLQSFIHGLGFNKAIYDSEVELIESVKIENEY